MKCKLRIFLTLCSTSNIASEEGIIMTENYSDYLTHRSNLITILALLSGFTFTSTIILVSRLSDPISGISQVLFLFAAILLDILVFLLLMNTVNIFFYIHNIPEPTRTTHFISLMSVISIGLWGFLLPFSYSLSLTSPFLHLSARFYGR